MKELLTVILTLLLLLTGCSSTPAPTTTQESTEGGPTMPKEYTYTCTTLSVQKGGQQIFGKVYRPDGAGKFPAIILSHGYNGIHADFTGECQFFAAKGYICYAFDFCGGSAQSKSSGESTDMTVFTEIEDLLAVLDHFRGMEEVDADNIFLLGGSQGGLVTALAAAQRPDQVKAVVLYFPALNIPDDWRRNYPNEAAIPEVTDFWGLKLGKNFFLSIRDLDPYAEIGAYKGNVLIFQGDKDNIVSMASSQRAAKIYEQANLIAMPGEGHGFTPNGLTKVMDHTLAFLLENR